MKKTQDAEKLGEGIRLAASSAQDVHAADQTIAELRHRFGAYGIDLDRHAAAAIMIAAQSGLAAAIVRISAGEEIDADLLLDAFARLAEAGAYALAGASK